MARPQNAMNKLWCKLWQVFDRSPGALDGRKPPVCFVRCQPVVVEQVRKRRLDVAFGLDAPGGLDK